MDAWLENFNALREAKKSETRSFAILGETLVYKAAIAPEVGFRLIAVQRKVGEDLEATRVAAELGEQPPVVTTDEEMLAVAEETIVDCLEPDSLPAWQRLRRPDSPEPLSFGEIFSLARYLVAKASGIPTGGPTDSSAGPQTTDPSLTDVLPSPEHLRAV